MRFNLIVLFLTGMVLSPMLNAQEQCVTYQMIPQTTYERTPVKLKRWIYETGSETKTVTNWKPVWTTETRERRTTVLKPVTKTSLREDRYTVLRPVYETKYREQTIEETVYETSTEIRKERTIVEKPVIETEYREEKHLVRKPVVENLIRVDTTTAYRPVIKNQTVYRPSALIVPEVAGTSPRLQRLNRGYYIDPQTGLSVFRRGGLHWVEQPRVTYGTIPTFTPQPVEELSYVPQTTKKETPVEVTTYRDVWESRKIPVQVQRTKQEIVIREIPVKVQRPKTIVKTEKVPYQEVRYEEQEIVRQVPTTEMKYEEVEQVEPYEVQVCKWVPVTQEVDMPTKKWRQVEVDAIRNTPRTVLMKVPVDQNGMILGPPTPVVQSFGPTTVIEPGQMVVESTAIGGASTSSAATVPTPVASKESAGKSVLETGSREEKTDEAASDDGQSIEYHGRAVELRKKPASKLLFPEPDDALDKPQTNLIEVKRAQFPDETDDASGSESTFGGADVEQEDLDQKQAADDSPVIAAAKQAPAKTTLTDSDDDSSGGNN